VRLRVTPRDVRGRLDAGESAAGDQHAAVRALREGHRDTPARLGGVERVRVSRGAGNSGGVGPAACGVYQPVERQRLALLVAECQRAAVEVDVGDRAGDGLDPGAAEDARAAARADGFPGGDLVPPGPFLPGIVGVDEDYDCARTPGLGDRPRGPVRGEQARIPAAEHGNHRAWCLLRLSGAGHGASLAAVGVSRQSPGWCDSSRIQAPAGAVRRS
jgi:hypothetical protein